MIQRDTARAWREIDLEALAWNARELQGALAPGCRLMAVLKADAYGHGAVAAAKMLMRQGVEAFAVACMEEGITLRQAGVKGVILVLGYTPPELAECLAHWQLTQTAVDADHAARLSRQGVPLQVHLALDTGMHRLGIPAQDHLALTQVFQLPSLKITGVFSHLCVSDSTSQEDEAYTHWQLEQFYAAVDWLRSCGWDPGAVHIQASYGVWNLPPQPCAYARVGIALYGVASDKAPLRRSLDLRPVLSLRARVALVRDIPAGSGAGYGLAFRAERDTRLAVVSIGYADGLPRDLAQRGGVLLLHGRRCPMVGRLCMDQLLVDVTDIPEVRAGDCATLIGRDGREELRAEEVAQCCGTISNELLSRLGTRLPKVFHTAAASPRLRKTRRGRGTAPGRESKSQAYRVL